MELKISAGSFAKYTSYLSRDKHAILTVNHVRSELQQKSNDLIAFIQV
jgi:hypothetical protein